LFNRTSIISVRNIGHHVTDSLLRLGNASRFFALTLLNSGTSFLRVRLIIRELYFTGVLSMIIILISGLFVGMVLGYQGYQTLKTYGSESALGVLVAHDRGRSCVDDQGGGRSNGQLRCGRAGGRQAV